jgi:phosphopantetheinyl transferase
MISLEASFRLLSVKEAYSKVLGFVTKLKTVEKASSKEISLK